MLKRLLKRVAVVVVALPLITVVVFVIGTRHVPYSIPVDSRAPEALLKPRQGLSVRYLGITGYELSDGQTVILVDPTPTRPTVLELISGPLKTDDAHGAEVCPRADFILVNHTHHDHALDVPAIALRTGAKVLGSQSTVNLAKSRGVAPDHTQVVHHGEHLTLGTFTVDVRQSIHSHIAGMSQPMSGLVAADAGPLWFWQYALDETLVYRFESQGTSVWFHPTSTLQDGELGGLSSPNLIVGVTGEAQTQAKVDTFMKEVKPRLVLPTHYDNFFQPMHKGLAAMPAFDMEPAHQMFINAPSKPTWVVLDYGQTLCLPHDDAP